MSKVNRISSHNLLLTLSAATMFTPFIAGAASTGAALNCSAPQFVTDGLYPFPIVDDAAGRNVVVHENLGAAGTLHRILDIGADRIPGTSDDGVTTSISQSIDPIRIRLASSANMDGRFLVYALYGQTGIELHSLDSVDGIFGNGNDLPAVLQGTVPTSQATGGLVDLDAEGTNITLSFGNNLVFSKDIATAPVTTLSALTLPTLSALQGIQGAHVMKIRGLAQGAVSFTAAFQALSLSFGVIDNPAAASTLVFDGSAGDGYITAAGGSAFLHPNSVAGVNKVALTDMTGGSVISTSNLATIPAGRRAALWESRVSSSVVNGRRLASWIELPAIGGFGSANLIVADVAHTTQKVANIQLSTSATSSVVGNLATNGKAIFANVQSAASYSVFVECH